MASDARGWGEPTRAAYYLYADHADEATAKALAAGGAPNGDRRIGVASDLTTTGAKPTADILADTLVS